MPTYDVSLSVYYSYTSIIMANLYHKSLVGVLAVLTLGQKLQPEICKLPIYNFDEDYCSYMLCEGKTLVYTLLEVCNLHCVSIAL